MGKIILAIKHTLIFTIDYFLLLLGFQITALYATVRPTLAAGYSPSDGIAPVGQNCPLRLCWFF